VSPHESHTSFIQTPKQLITVVLLAFLIPIIGIILIVQLVTSERRPDPNALTPESVAQRIAPIGRVEFGGAGGGGAAGARSGEEVVKTTCATCHQAGVAGAPKMGDKAQWAPRLKQGQQQLVANAVKGKGAMPPKGGNTALSDDEVARAVVFMANQAGAGFKEPAAKAPAQKPEAVAAAPGAKPAAADGKKVYDTTCTACHTAGVANAPKLGDKAAWAARVQQGMDALLQSALKGKGAMPPKGGAGDLSDAELARAVVFMANQSGASFKEPAAPQKPAAKK
jgi:cytochrome c5